MAYVYDGNEVEFFEEFGGLPKRSISLANGFLITIIIISILVIAFVILLLFQRSSRFFVEHTGRFNLDELDDLNNENTECCVFAGDLTGNEIYVYDTVSDITYSRDVPLNINTVCNTFPNPSNCISQNTDSEGNVIPVATFKAKPYYTFEKGLFIICDSTTTCD